ncbi:MULTISPECIES: glycosyltransferase [unclassified Mesorhizobium]|uniref:glycosyltransferase n=1 Tax=unclassified Mesorhizobium TaxID=325217 RepID=UPI000F756BED|nr:MULTISPECIES: glycosyltransferase [unclassified Mesorhizobium]AZO66648.1 glycosyltransferase [Mesorhizobium sp. M6A.T.Cr.TU.016.01.1.1]RUU27776.1 glycosyltransferase [Mesorhizobium sp. M6A.T.Ce.TU.016.01.1.1]RVB78307.1 glycosyltransferase [Mesorhizobium sp. M6A.T.Cr.TU.014.01.1.1]RWP44514.1 MAG: glycosyltransferase [Mesorhizobium sp.]RWP48231.1 MAG: glycosyltransferase [Mesorhizobium sp.]
MRKGRRIIVVVTALPRWISDFNHVSTALAEAGHAVEVWSPDDNGLATAGWDSRPAIDAARDALAPDIATRTMPFSRNRGRPSLLRLARASLMAARAALFSPGSVFILWSALSILLAGPWVRLSNRHAIYLVTGLGASFSESQRGSLTTRLICIVYRFAFASRRAIVIVHNHEDKAELIRRTGVAADRVIVTGGCGVMPEDFPYKQARAVGARPTILVPGRLLRDKGVLDAAAASGLLSERGVAHRMVFTSNPMSGRADALTEAELARARSYPDVAFIGYQPSITALYAGADIACIPSWYREGLQTALLESASSGCPIVACDNVGVRDFLRPEIDALVVPPHAPARLADALERMIREPGLAERLRTAAYARFLSGFTRQHMVEATLAAMRGTGIETPR